MDHHQRPRKLMKLIRNLLKMAFPSAALIPGGVGSGGDSDGTGKTYCNSKLRAIEIDCIFIVFESFSLWIKQLHFVYYQPWYEEYAKPSLLG